MFDAPAIPPSARAESIPVPQTAPPQGHQFPDPSDRGACARFRLRQKTRQTSSSQRSSSSDAAIATLEDATLDLYHQVNNLMETVLQQAVYFREELSACMGMVRNVSDAVASAAMTSVAMARATPSQPVFSSPAEELSQSCEDVPSSSHAPSNVPAVPTTPESNMSPSVPIPVDNPSPTSPSSLPAPVRPENKATSSVSSTLPRLRGFFNKPTQKARQHGSLVGFSSTQPG
ncbi:hypothetical protein BDZ97DRAFT_1843978 [Flammula alnicola]|nr:hypothetical protein BDZ97DRAFT_1843978 [Flammula alnicola]